MIVCPNCNHANQDGAVHCEACFTPLPATVNCPSCGATVQADASFCGQCGFNLRVAAATAVAAPSPTEIPLEVPPLAEFDPLISPQPVVVTASSTFPEPSELPPTVVTPEVQPVGSETVASLPVMAPPPIATPDPEPVAAIPYPELDLTMAPDPEPVAEAEVPVMVVPEATAPEATMMTAPPPEVEVTSLPANTQLQQITSLLIHVQSDRKIELPQNLSVIHIGKTNDRIPPDIDVSGFPNSEVVSRIHADIRVEGDAYYIEDAGSSNGTYINNLPLLPGNRHRLRPGDRVSLGKGDLVTFLFQLS
jgi:FHA domain/Double zinc ribbon